MVKRHLEERVQVAHAAPSEPDFTQHLRGARPRAGRNRLEDGIALLCAVLQPGALGSGHRVATDNGLERVDERIEISIGRIRRGADAHILIGLTRCSFADRPGHLGGKYVRRNLLAIDRVRCVALTRHLGRGRMARPEEASRHEKQADRWLGNETRSAHGRLGLGYRSDQSWQGNRDAQFTTLE